MHVTLAPAWFDPADNTGIATPFHGARRRCTTRS
jgi:hypothetical protein